MITVFFGPPGAGKTTLALKEMKPGDVIVDSDLLFSAISGTPMYGGDKMLLKLVLDVRDYLISRSAAGIWRYSGIWIVTSSRKLAERMRSEYQARVLYVDVSEEECIYRIAQDTRRNENIKMWEGIVHKWFEENKPFPRDVVIENERR